ncbi:MAG: MotA/TolQ/ExbB proton channel family protein [Pirellulaceae bacterium]
MMIDANADGYDNSTNDGVPLQWAKNDIEQVLGFRGQRFTRVNSFLSFFCGVLMTVGFYAFLTTPIVTGTHFQDMFLQRGATPYFIILFSCWSLSILAIKFLKLRLQRKALSFEIVPTDPDFVLSPDSAADVIEKIYDTTDEPRHFFLFSRLLIALGNLKNLGRIADVEDMLRSQAEHEEAVMETSYVLLRGFVWAIPVLGFIGTVIGLSQAVGGFGQVLGTATEITQISSSLKSVTAGLATAFETTLEALVAALIIQLLLTFLRKSEQEFLEACTEYCHRRVVSRLRTMPYQQESGSP